MDQTCSIVLLLLLIQKTRKMKISLIKNMKRNLIYLLHIYFPQLRFSKIQGAQEEPSCLGGCSYASTVWCESSLSSMEVSGLSRAIMYQIESGDSSWRTLFPGKWKQQNLSCDHGRFHTALLQQVYPIERKGHITCMNHKNFLALPWKN
jgi:hypothetical protein